MSSLPPDDLGFVIRDIQRDIKEIRHELTLLDSKFDDYTHRYQFEPVRNVAYGTVYAMVLILVGAIGTLLAVG